MKKTITLITLFAVGFSNLFAQVVNPSFETWRTSTYTFDLSGLGLPLPPETYNYNDIDGWTSTNQITKASFLGGQEMVSRESTIKMHGDYAVKLETKNISVPLVGDFDIPGIVIGGDFELELEVLLNIFGGATEDFDFYSIPGTGQVMSTRPLSFVGHFNYAPSGSDSAWINSALVRNTGNGRELIALAQTFIKTNTNGYQFYELEYEYFSCATPDTVVTFFSSSYLDPNTQFTGNPGSVLYADSLGFSGTAPLLPPNLRDDFVSVVEGFIATINASSNDSYCDGDFVDPVVYINPANGSVIINADGNFEYTPNTGFTGSDEFQYYDCNSAGCDTATVFIEVIPVPPCITNDITRGLTVNNTDIFSPSFSDCDYATLTIVTDPSNGTVTIGANDQFIYTPDTDFSGTDFFTYSMCSPYDPSDCSTSTVTLTVISGITQLDPSVLTTYPNPARSVINVLLNSSDNAKIALYDLRGSMIYMADFTNYTEINVGNLPEGLYILKVETAAGVANRKIQIAR
jgi:hypothetical protein